MGEMQRKRTLLYSYGYNIWENRRRENRGGRREGEHWEAGRMGGVSLGDGEIII